MNRRKCSTHDEVHVGLRHLVCKRGHDRFELDIIRVRRKYVCGTRGSMWAGKTLTACMSFSQSGLKDGRV
jgi:hypothetical protein